MRGVLGGDGGGGRVGLVALGAPASSGASGTTGVCGSAARATFSFSESSRSTFVGSVLVMRSPSGGGVA
ncbi:hypothetical protein WY02_16930 [Pseudonocardia sp. AL041005-10]|nr:hypothetical protein WY02_16930 [Pseudonocardia sp. AL041005-10]